MNRVVDFKVHQKEEKTLTKTLELIMEGWKFEKIDFENFRIGALLVEGESGLRVIPLKSDITTYEYIGFLDTAKSILIDSTFDDEEEE